MRIEIQLTDSPIVGPPPPAAATGAGAWVEFRGLVRGEENGQVIAALEYEAYPAMAVGEMRRILEQLARDWPCQAARVIHRVGVIAVGEAAIYVGVAGPHRAEAFALLTEFMNRLKQDVPIWKRRAIAASPVEVPDSSRPQAQPAAVRPGAERGEALSADEVVALIRGLCPPLEPEPVELAGASGRVLRVPVTAPEDQPPFDRSSVDGFAVLMDDPAPRFQIVDEIRAGDWKPRELRPGEAVRIATGGALPGEGLRVVMKEDARVEGGQVMLPPREHERNIRFRGEDARAGQGLVELGTVLSAGALGLLASVGATCPVVTRLPRVVHLATGNEIVPPEQTPARGQIRDSNSTLVRAFLAGWGIVPDQRRLPEEESALQAALGGRQPPTDLLLISGGASVGEHDFTRRLLETAGFTLHVRKTTARPGKPLIVARRGGTLAFGLPGNPLAHFVCLNLYVRAALEAWSRQGVRSEFAPGALAEGLQAGGNDRETYWAARWHSQGGSVRLTPLRWASSGDLTALARANAILRLPPGADRLARGQWVEFVRTDPS